MATQPKLTNNYIIISRDASSDSADQMFSIFKMIDSINFNTPKEEAAQFKAARDQDTKTAMGLNIRYTVCSSWSLDELSDKDVPLKFELAILDPQGNQLLGQLQEAVLPKGNDVFRFNFVTEGFPYTEDGKYSVVIRALDSDSKIISKASSRVRLMMNVQA